MKKFIFIISLLLVFSLSACDEENTVDKGDGTVIEDSGSNGDKTDTEKDDDQGDYVKDGDVPNYFRVFGTHTIVASGDDWAGSDSYIITHTFSDGMSVEMIFYDIDNVYDEFKFVATKGDETLVFDVDLKVELSPKVSYSQPGMLVQGFMNFNGIDQSPVFELNTNWEYTVFNESDITSMNTMMVQFVSNMNGYYNENIDSDFVQPNN